MTFELLCIILTIDYVTGIGNNATRAVVLPIHLFLLANSDDKVTNMGVVFNGCAVAKSTITIGGRELFPILVTKSIVPTF